MEWNLESIRYSYIWWLLQNFSLLWCAIYEICNCLLNQGLLQFWVFLPEIIEYVKCIFFCVVFLENVSVIYIMAPTKFQLDVMCSLWDVQLFIKSRVCVNSRFFPKEYRMCKKNKNGSEIWRVCVTHIYDGSYKISACCDVQFMRYAIVY